MRSDGGRVHAGDNARSRRRAHAGDAITVGVTDAALGNGVDVRRPRPRISVTGKGIGAGVLAGDPEDIRTRPIRREDGRGGRGGAQELPAMQAGIVSIQVFAALDDTTK